ncbi:MAG: ATP-binding cassette domain-containing protein [Magnetococcales bacterium]|nr:ATP-binding cassette domain-containing protein [Magnetococcales bacterium]
MPTELTSAIDLPPPRTTGAAGEPLIQARGIRVAMGDDLLLDQVDLWIAPGEIVTLIGPNGAGKTTLLKVLLGLLQPTAGSVQRRAGLRVGYVPQRLVIDPVLPLPVARLMTLTHREPLARVRQALAETGVEHRLQAPVHGLSGGEFQRVMLARAILRKPDLLVLDEPVQGVDVSAETALYQLIAGLRDRHGWSILLVSHDLHLVMESTDRVICLNRRICCEGQPDGVSRHPEFTKLFGPHASRTLALYSHHNHQGEYCCREDEPCPHRGSATGEEGAT